MKKILTFCKNIFWRKWQKPSKKRSTNYYSSLYELPIFNWFELNKTGDLSHLQKDPDKPLTNGVILAYYRLKDEHFRLFGVPEEYEKHLNSMKYYGLMMAKYLESGGEGSLLTHIQIAKLNLERDDDGEPFDYTSIWAFVISKMATVPNIKKMSTFDFLSLYKVLSNG